MVDVERMDYYGGGGWNSGRQIISSTHIHGSTFPGMASHQSENMYSCISYKKAII